MQHNYPQFEATIKILTNLNITKKPKLFQFRAFSGSASQIIYGYATSAIRFYTDSKQVASQKIDSMNEVLNASPAAFELIRSIVRRTHTAILDGENMENIRFRYTREMDEYFQKYAWDN